MDGYDFMRVVGTVRGDKEEIMISGIMDGYAERDRILV